MYELNKKLETEEEREKKYQCANCLSRVIILFYLF